jgi:Type II secretion system (T2SS), protein M subtype b
MKLSVTGRDRKAVFAGITFLALAIALPRYLDLRANLNADLALSRRHLYADASAIADSAHIRSRLAAARARNTVLNNKVFVSAADPILTGAAVKRMVENISNIAKTQLSKIEVTSTRTEPNAFARIQLDVRLEGTLESVLVFLSMVEQGTIVDIANISLHRVTGSNQPINDQMVLELSMAVLSRSKATT